VKLARERCKDLPNVNIVCGELPSIIPAGSFDLIVLSEIGYYFNDTQLAKLGQKLVRRLSQPGTLLATHWLGTSDDHLLHGDQVHEILAGLSGLRHIHFERHRGFRLDRWDRA